MIRNTFVHDPHNHYHYKETSLQYFLVILKRPLQYYSNMLNKCFLRTICIDMCLECFHFQPHKYVLPVARAYNDITGPMFYIYFYDHHILTLPVSLTLC